MGAGEAEPGLVGVSIPVILLVGVSTRTDEAAVSGLGPGNGKSLDVI
jgi:arginine deiminase